MATDRFRHLRLFAQRVAQTLIQFLKSDQRSLQVTLRMQAAFQPSGLGGGEFTVQVTGEQFEILIVRLRCHAMCPA